jgi:hypothetical protein
MLEELLDTTEMDSDEDTFNRQDTLNRILEEPSDDSGVDSDNGSDDTFFLRWPSGLKASLAQNTPPSSPPAPQFSNSLCP